MKKVEPVDCDEALMLARTARDWSQQWIERLVAEVLALRAELRTR